MFSIYFFNIWSLCAVELKEFKLALGRKVAMLRKRNGMTQPELGALLGKDFQNISRIENGKVNISAHSMYEIANALQVSVNELLDFSKLDELSVK